MSNHQEDPNAEGVSALERLLGEKIPNMFTALGLPKMAPSHESTLRRYAAPDGRLSAPQPLKYFPIWDAPTNAVCVYYQIPFALTGQHTQIEVGPHIKYGMPLTPTAAQAK